MIQSQYLRTALLAVLCVLAGCAHVTAGGGRPPHIYVIGDSTASVYGPDRYPRMGWAQVLQEYFDPTRAVVVDAARSGRSAKSFFEEGHWDAVLEALQRGDYVLIQFGHNDSKKDDPNRFTDPATTFQQFLRTYIEDTRAKGAHPILVTSINRNAWDGETLKDTLGGYPPAMRELAKEKNVPLLDLHARTRELFQQLGPDKVKSLFMILDKGSFPNFPDGIVDNTHLREAGAREVSKLAAEAIQDSTLPLRRAVLPNR